MVAIVLISSTRLRPCAVKVDVTQSLPDAPILSVLWSDPGLLMIWRQGVAPALWVREGTKGTLPRLVASLTLASLAIGTEQVPCDWGQNRRAAVVEVLQ